MKPEEIKRRVRLWRDKNASLIESINIPFAVFDSDYVMWYANELLLDLIGADDEDNERIRNGFDIREALTDAEFKQIYDKIEPSEIYLKKNYPAERKKFYQYELDIHHFKTGETIPVLFASSINIDDEGIHDLTYVTLTDLRDQKKMMARLEDEKNKLETILFSTGECVSVYDMNGKLLMRNPRGKDILKERSSPILPLGSDSPQTIVLSHNHDPRHYEGVIKPVKNHKGKDFAYVEIFKDITADIKLKGRELELGRMRRKLMEIELGTEMIGVSRGMRNVFDLVVRCAEVDSTVLIQGETGVGKELVAKAIHDHSSRKKMPFVAVNCGALPGNLLESELFGHIKGAFTGAVSDRKGLFREARGGTIFLDEIGDIDPMLQVKLLRALQEKEIRPVGSDKTVSIDLRVISATNRDLKGLAQKEQYRQDLYYRLAVISIFVPPLRERVEDILPLVEYFMGKKTKKNRKIKPKRLGHAAQKALLQYDWPGNVRELENTVEHIWAMCRTKEIHPRDLPVQVVLQENMGPAQPGREPEYEAAAGSIGYSHPLKPWEKEDKKMIEARLIEFKGNRTQTAKALGISRPTLWRRIKDYGIRL